MQEKINFAAVGGRSIRRIAAGDVCRMYFARNWTWNISDEVREFSDTFIGAARNGRRCLIAT